MDRSAVLINYYDCDMCGERKKIDCITTYEESIREIACICEGKDTECKICDGGTFSIFKCPKVVMNEVRFLYRLYPFFKRYRDSKCIEMPCGSYYESTFLICEAFKIMTTIDEQEIRKATPKE